MKVYDLYEYLSNKSYPKRHHHRTNEEGDKGSSPFYNGQSEKVAPHHAEERRIRTEVYDPSKVTDLPHHLFSRARVFAVHRYTRPNGHHYDALEAVEANNTTTKNASLPTTWKAPWPSRFSEALTQEH